MYAKGKTIQKQFDIGSAVVNECRRFITNHPERYGQYGNIRNLTSMIAFVDAYKYRKVEDDDELPPFEPDQSVMLLGGKYEGN